MGAAFLKQKEMEVRKNMGEFRYEKVKDPEYFMDHRMDAHSDHVAYASWKESEKEKSSYRYSLDGIWKFHYAKNYEQTIKGFEETTAGMTSVFRLIYRWKDMIPRSM